MKISDLQWTGKEVLITGGTGSLGSTLVRKIAKKEVKGIRVFSRDELKQWKLKNELEQENFDKNISFLIGDIRDEDRLEMATRGVDIIIHTAAMKQVPACEYNPLEAIKTNINGAQNILNVAIKNKVQKVMNVSTDKAVYPVNLYGATKLCAEKLFINGNVYSPILGTRFSCCRYGNVLGSRGSIIPLFKKQNAENGSITITDNRMTRFWITMCEVTNFIIESIERMAGGEIFIPKMPSASVLEIAGIVAPQAIIKPIGIRDGEKLHEVLITKEESKFTAEYDDYFEITSLNDTPSTVFEYASNTNQQKLTPKQIEEIKKI